MTNEGWRDLVKQAVHEADAGQESMLDNLVQVLCDIDLAKQKLRDLGFGWTGMDILETVGEVEEWVQTVKDKTERTGALIDRLLACIPNAQERVTT